MLSSTHFNPNEVSYSPFPQSLSSHIHIFLSFLYADTKLKSIKAFFNAAFSLSASFHAINFPNSPSTALSNSLRPPQFKFPSESLHSDQRTLLYGPWKAHINSPQTLAARQTDTTWVISASAHLSFRPISSPRISTSLSLLPPGTLHPATISDVLPSMSLHVNPPPGVTFPPPSLFLLTSPSHIHSLFTRASPPPPPASLSPSKAWKYARVFLRFVTLICVKTLKKKLLKDTRVHA